MAPRVPEYDCDDLNANHLFHRQTLLEDVRQEERHNGDARNRVSEEDLLVSRDCQTWNHQKVHYIRYAPLLEVDVGKLSNARCER